MVFNPKRRTANFKCGAQYAYRIDTGQTMGLRVTTKVELLASISWRTHSPPDGTVQLCAYAVELAVIARRGGRRDMVLSICFLTQRTGNFRHYATSALAFAFADAEAGDVILHIAFVVVAMIWIIELLAARRFQIADPSQVMAVDEIGVEAKSTDDQIFRRPADGPAEVFEGSCASFR